MNTHDLLEDDALTEEQEVLVAALSPEQIKMIAAELLSTCGSQWRKVAYVVGMTMSELSNIDGIPDIFFSHRVQHLVSEGLLESAGDLKHMRYCEVRVPVSGT